jgi:hypothetical protein
LQRPIIPLIPAVPHVRDTKGVAHVTPGNEDAKRTAHEVYLRAFTCLSAIYTEAVKDVRAQNQSVLVGFRSVYVFDVSQTEGLDLPELSSRVCGEVGERMERLLDFVSGQGILLEFKESIAPALGISYGGKIVLLPGQTPAEEFSTLVHEVAHLCCVRSYVA